MFKFKQYMPTSNINDFKLIIKYLITFYFILIMHAKNFSITNQIANEFCSLISKKALKIIFRYFALLKRDERDKIRIRKNFLNIYHNIVLMKILSRLNGDHTILVNLLIVFKYF